MPALKFNIRHQHISRVDCFLPVRYSKNYLYAEFNFLTEDWEGVAKTAVFKSQKCSIPVVLGEGDTCLVPHEVLEEVKFSVTVFGGDLITVNSEDVKVFESGYRSDLIEPPTPDVYTQILTALNGKADDLKYENNILYLMANQNAIASVKIVAGTGSGSGSDGREVELRNNGEYIQWRYSGEEDWVNLVALADLKGEKGDNYVLTDEDIEEIASKVKVATSADKITYDDTATKLGAENVQDAIGQLTEQKIDTPTVAQVGQTLKVKAIDENGKPTEWECVDGVQADWNQNDETAKDYVKNRPFYAESVEELICDKHITEFEDMFGDGSVYSSYLYYDGHIDDYVDGNTYIIYFNNVRYEYVFYDDNGYMGNLSLDDVGEDTGEPFLTDGWMLWTKTNEPCDFKVICKHENVVTIPEKYMPAEEYDLVIGFSATDTLLNVLEDNPFEVQSGSVMKVLEAIRNDRPYKIAIKCRYSFGGDIYNIAYHPIYVMTDYDSMRVNWIMQDADVGLDNVGYVYTIKIFRDGTINNIARARVWNNA